MAKRVKPQSPEEKLFATGRQVFEKDTFAKAFPYFKQAADLGHPPAIYTVGKCLLYGHGIATDIKEALVWLKDAYTKGVVRAGFFIFHAYRKLEMEDKAFEACLAAAMAGEPHAQLHTAHNYRNGYGTSPNPQAATEWYKRASASGNPEATHILRERNRSEADTARRNQQRTALRRRSSPKRG